MPQETIVIRPHRPWDNLDVRQYLRSRYMLRNLIYRDLRAQFDNMYFGVVWMVARPLLMVGMFVFFQRYSAAAVQVSLPYALYLFTGLVVWFSFVEATQQAAGSLHAHADLLKKVYYPRLFTPLAASISQMASMAIAAVPLAAMILYFRQLPDWHLLMLPLLVLILVLLAFAIGTLVACLTLRNRDAERALSFCLYLGLFVSPVIYSPAMIPEAARAAYSLNPMVGILEGFRAALLGPGVFPWTSFGYSAAFTAGTLILAAFVYSRVEAVLVDEL